MGSGCSRRSTAIIIVANRAERLHLAVVPGRHSSIDKSGRAQIRTGSLRLRNSCSPRSLRRPTISAISAVAELAAAITGWPTTSGLAMKGKAEDEFSLADLAADALPQQQLETGLVINLQNLGRAHRSSTNHKIT